MPYKVGIIFRDGRPVTYDSGDYPVCQEKALAAAGYDDFAARQEAARKQGRYIGLGFANAVEATGLGPYESATARVSTSGKITVYTGATPQGQSHKTTLAQIAADQFGCTPDDMTIVTADTAATALGVGSFAARTAVNAGSSVHLASIEAGAQDQAIRRRDDGGRGRGRGAGKRPRESCRLRSHPQLQGHRRARRRACRAIPWPAG